MCAGCRGSRISRGDSASSTTGAFTAGLTSVIRCSAKISHAGERRKLLERRESLGRMFTFGSLGRLRWLGAIATALIATVVVVSVAVLLLKPMLEQAVRARIESAAARHGVVARIGLVHVGV